MLATCATPLRFANAQTGSAPTLIATVLVGGSGGQTLWEIGQQPLCLTNNCSVHDTLAIARKTGTAFLGGLAVSYFPASSSIGAEAELALGFRGLVDQCSNVAPYATDSIVPGRNQHICHNLPSAAPSFNTVSVYLGLVARASPRRTVSPYLRVGIGIETFSTSSLAMAGSYLLNSATLDQSVIVDSTPKKTTLSGVAAAGLTLRLGSYLARLEVSDRTASLPRPTGPASDAGVVPTETHLYHQMTLSLGLGFALNGTHGRRY